MTAYVALLRAVNVGGTGKLPMTALAELCLSAGFVQVKTYIASGNVVFRSDGSEEEVRTALERRLTAHMGRPASVLVRAASEMAQTLARNPFPQQPANRVMALFFDGAPPSDPLEGATGVQGEEVRLGQRELFIFYPDGMAKTRLRLPAEKTGSARNMNTVAKLAAMAAAIA
ncbi:DUF1697 domain-containing protein [Methylocystis heyeri]|uniref:DUF1697 domain-containing protein n=1 Tax=Methylocystis heyeri TaxID=391905 RepID=A0A6B8KAI6_9HYPH|nr:DUF1697 domain-containing protein [Methylocystis heyeri]QGM44859.1 DUF1697 domain-containing protein [Methylocystis heyeri]